MQSGPIKWGRICVHPRSNVRIISGSAKIVAMICLRPGTEIAFEEEACREGALFRRKMGDRVARFRQVDLDNPTVHHDALEFPDGTIVKVNDLVVGQRARIVQLPAEPKIAAAEPRSAQEAVLETPDLVIG